MKLEEITESKNPEVPPPKIKSRGEIMTHLEITRTSGRIIVPNPLFDLTTIYDEEENLEVSLVTPVKIVDEKEPERASTPSPDALVQSHS
jgi:hypothetical protein